MQKLFLIFLFFLVAGVASAQKKVSISGIVMNESNKPLDGANVYIRETLYGTATTKEGLFKLKNIVPGKYLLYVSYSGYKRLKFEINANTNISNLKLKLQKTNGTFGEIVVTGTGTPHHEKMAPVPTELITKKMIEASAAPDFPSLMSSISPSFDFSPGGMGPNIQLNGLSNKFIAILVDGKRMYGGIGQMSDLSRVNPSNIEKIEVVKGASSSLYGSDAIAGVINIITKKSRRKLEVNNNTLYSTYNTLQQSNSISFNGSKLSGHTVFTTKRTDGWQNSPYGLDRHHKLTPTDAMTQNAYLNHTFDQDLTFKASKRLKFTGNIRYYNNDIKYPTSVKPYGFFFEDMSYNFGAEYLLPHESSISFDYASDNFDYYHKYSKVDKSFAIGDLDRQHEQIRNAYNIKYINKLNSNNLLSAGVELVEEKYNAKNETAGNAYVNTLAFYAQDEINMLKNLMLTAGIRVVKHKLFGTTATPKISALYKMGAFNLRSTYSRGYKAPTLKELYIKWESYGNLYIGNKNLKPQLSDYYSAGIDFHKTWFSSSISAYRNNVNNFIAYDVIDQNKNGYKTIKQYSNINDTRSQGADFLFDVKLPDNFTIGGGYSYVDARNEATDERLSYVAHNYVNLRAGYSHAWKNYSLNVMLLGRIQDGKYDKYKKVTSKPYQLWKLSTIQKFASLGIFNVSATAGIDNIFNYIDDQPYGSYLGTISPGRTYFVGLNFSFSK